MELQSVSSKAIPPEKVKRNNTDIWKYSTILFVELRKERFSKADPSSYNRYLEDMGINGYVTPFDLVDLKLDIQKFKDTLNNDDRNLFDFMLLGMKHREIVEITGMSQGNISIRLKKLREEFKKFYLD